MRTLQKEKLNIFNFLALTVAGIVNATGITFFLQPVHLYDSGISGTSMFLSMVTPLPLSVFLLIFNVPLFLYGLKRQGKVFTIYAIYTVAIYSLAAWLITDILPIDVSITSPPRRLGPLPLRALRRSPFRRGKRHGNPFWRRDGRHRGHGGHLCEETQPHRRLLRHDL